MASGCCVLVLAFAFLLSSPAAYAFNITRILDHNAGFGTFNSYLTQTELAGEINRRQTITVLAVDDAAAAALSGQPLEVVKKVLSVHVILDYYDVPKLQHLHKKTALVTTLFQSTGLAVGQMGFLNVSVSAAGVALGSAVAGAGAAVQLVTAVAAQPYNISVLQVSGVIFPPGIQNTNYTASPPPPPPPAAATPETAPAPESSPPPASSPATTAPTPAAVDDDASPPAPETPDAAPAASPTTAAADDDDEGAAPGPADVSPAARASRGAAVAAAVAAAVLSSLAVL